MPRLRPSPAERVAAWLVTGPAGHLYAGAADWLVLVVRWRLDTRTRRRRGGSRA